MENKIVDLILSSQFVVLGIAGLFIAYRFYMSQDGELRKILIVKNLALMWIFFTLAAMVAFGDNRTITILANIPAIFAFGWMIKYLLKRG